MTSARIQPEEIPMFIHVFHFIAGHPAMYGTVLSLAPPLPPANRRFGVPRGWATCVHLPPLLRTLRFDFCRMTSGQWTSVRQAYAPPLLQDGLIIAGPSSRHRILIANMIAALLPEPRPGLVPVSARHRAISMRNYPWSRDDHTELTATGFQYRDMGGAPMGP